MIGPPPASCGWPHFSYLLGTRTSSFPLSYKGIEGLRRNGFSFSSSCAGPFASMALPASALLAESNGVQWSGSELVRGELDAMSSIGFIPPQAAARGEY